MTGDAQGQHESIFAGRTPFRRIARQQNSTDVRLGVKWSQVQILSCRADQVEVCQRGWGVFAPSTGTIVSVSGGRDYELAWPRELIRDDLSELINAHQRQDWEIRVDLLLRNAFTAGVPAHDFEAAGGTGFAARTDKLSVQRKFLASLLERLDSFPMPSARRPYWSERQTGVATRDTVTLESTTRAFVEMVNQLHNNGYFEGDL
jgi:hypothetical protein